MSVGVGVDNEYLSYKHDGDYPSAYFFVHPNNEHRYRKATIWMHKTEGYVYGKVQTDKLSVGGAIRQMASKQFSGTLSYQATIKYSLNKHNDLIASFGEYNAVIRPNYYMRNFNKAFSRQFSLDYKGVFGGSALTVTVYHKRERTPLLLLHTQKTHPVANRITGVELSGKQSWHNLSATVCYTYLRSTSFLDDKWHRSENDFGHTAKFELTYFNANLLNASLNCIYHPGKYFTPITGKTDVGTQAYPVFGAYNSERLPHYMALNLSLNKIFQVGRTTIVAYLTATNLLNRTNANYAYYDAEYTTQQIEPLQRRLVYFGVMASF